MHIYDVLPPTVSLVGFAATAGAVTVAARRFDETLVPRTAVVTSLFFVVSTIQIPLGFSSVHLSLTGLVGIALGWTCFPSILVALFLQFLLLGEGGIASLGVNTMTMGSGALVSFLAFRALWRSDWSLRRVGTLALAASLMGSLTSAVLYFIAMASAGRGLESVAKVLVLFHVPAMIADALVTASAASFLLRVKPDFIAVGGRESRKSGVHSRPAAPEAKEPAARSRVLLLGIGVALLGLFGLGPRAEAHSLDVLVRLAGNQVRVEAFFSDGTPVRRADVTVTEADGEQPTNEILRGTTDRDGFFFFRPVRLATLEVTIEDAAGHRKSVVLAAERLAGLFPSAELEPSAANPDESAGTGRTIRRKEGTDGSVLNTEVEDPGEGWTVSSEDQGVSGSLPLAARLGLGVAAIALLAVLLRWALGQGQRRHASRD
jgi:cobalt/nickel transport system permease protein